MPQNQQTRSNQAAEGRTKATIKTHTPDGHGSIPMLRASFATEIHDPWTRMQPVRLGNVPEGAEPGAPNLFVTVSSGETPAMLIALYAEEDKVYGFEEIRIWRNFVGIGFGRYAFLVNLLNRGTATYDLESDFCQFFTLPELMLIAGTDGLGAINPLGEVLWDARGLATRGVLIERVAEGRVVGRGYTEDGWKPFVLDLETGERL